MKLWDRLTRRGYPLEKIVASVPLASPAEPDLIAFQDITAQDAVLKVSDPGLQVLDVRFEYDTNRTTYLEPSWRPYPSYRNATGNWIRAARPW